MFILLKSISKYEFYQNNNLNVSKEDKINSIFCLCGIKSLVVIATYRSKELKFIVLKNYHFLEISFLSSVKYSEANGPK